MDGRQRHFLSWLTALSVVCLVVQALTGVSELALYLTPLFLIAALLLSGHYVAEDRIVEGWIGPRRAPLRRSGTRGRRLRAPIAHALVLERSPQCRRGPPARVSHALAT